MRRILIAFTATFAVALPVAIVMARAGDPPREPAPAALPREAAPSAPTDTRIQSLQATVRAAPKRADGWTLLAGAYLQKVRETGDAGFYARAEGAVDRALTLRPADAGALTQRAALELSRHDFRAGLADARRARALAPTVTQPFGVLVDALVELGRYPEAGRALQEMVDRKPDVAAYARVSYFRELNGDLDGALAAMRLAVSAGGAVPEQNAYVRSLLGGLELQRGRIDSAVHAYREALAAVPGYPAAEAGLAQADVARGRLPAAIARLQRLTTRLPLPAYLTALGEAQEAAGREAARGRGARASAREVARGRGSRPTVRASAPEAARLRAAARETFALVRVEAMLQARAGVNGDVEMALFEADHGSAARAVTLARRAWAAAPSVRSADALGWALHRAGQTRAALGWARRALALGSRDPSFLTHAGLIARAAGDRNLATRRLAAVRDGVAALGAGLRAELASAAGGEVAR